MTNNNQGVLMFRNAGICCIGLSIVASIFLCNASLAESVSNSTVWKPVNQSLAELLDTGWKIVNQSSTRVAVRGYDGYDVSSFNFTLQKNGKYIICMIDSPSVDKTVSRCRQLN
jgi:hypothetical protein